MKAKKNLIPIRGKNGSSKEGKKQMMKLPEAETSSPVCFLGKEKFREGFEDAFPGELQPQKASKPKIRISSMKRKNH
jgi:hypothetical protein